MIIRSHGSDVAYRMAEWGSEHVIPAPGSGWLSITGDPVTSERVFGLPAALQAIRQASVTVASLTLAVFEGEGATKRRVKNPQSRLLDNPTLEVSRFDWMSDMNSGLEGFGNGFALKIRDGRGRVVALDPIHPNYMQVRRKDGFKVFDAHYEGKTRMGMTARDVFHLRGFSIGPALAGHSPIMLHRHSLGVAAAQEDFVGEFFANDARPTTYLKTEAKIDQATATMWGDLWKAQFAGRGNRNKIAVLGGGLDVGTLPISLQDAQFIEGRGFGIEELARIFNWPAWALDHTEENETLANTEQKTSQLLVFHVMPRLKRWQSALRDDPDLFGETVSYPEFVTDDFVMIDAATRAEVEHKGVQSGTLLRDEVRADHGRPPLPEGLGQIPQVTPVGGAPNPVPLPSLNGSEE